MSNILPTDVDIKDFRLQDADVKNQVVHDVGEVFRTCDGQEQILSMNGWQNTHGRSVNEAVYTYTGRFFWVRDPHIDDFCVADFAHGLASENRFSGTMGFNYDLSNELLSGTGTFIGMNVAQHCVNLYNMVPEKHKIAAITHDIPEAYIRDIPHPIKKIPEFYELYVKWDRKIFECVAEKYRFDPTVVDHPDFLFYDRLMGHLEMSKYFGNIETKVCLTQYGYNEAYLNLIDNVIAYDSKIQQDTGKSFLFLLPSVNSEREFTRIFNETF